MKYWISDMSSVRSLMVCPEKKHRPCTAAVDSAESWRYIYATYIFTLKSSVEKLCVSTYIHIQIHIVCIYVLLVKGMLTEML